MRKGSLTIELSIIMPLILGLFVVIVFSGFLLHDKCIVNKACMSAALRASLEREDAPALEKAYEAMAEVIPGRLMCRWDYETDIDVGEDEVRVTFLGSSSVGGLFAGRILSNPVTGHDFECSAYRLDQSGYIRSHKRDEHSGRDDG
ncbi:MAG: pilus assembly protein [Lachnospiraceae bacterium]|nr:pilus assembly protein [Lachnospiraceae bacterium]